MYRFPEPWQTAEVPGPKKAMVITKPEVVSSMIKKAKNVLIIVGHEAADIRFSDGRSMIDYIIEVAEKANANVVATAHTPKEFIKRGFEIDAWMPAVEIADRLADPEWNGIDGRGAPDLAVFTGIPYYMEWLILSGLKHFSPKLKTISLDMHYQPHASWSFPNLSSKEWEENLKAILKDLGGK